MGSTSREASICAGTVSLAALFLYSSTLAPTVTLVDSGELIVAAHSLGVAHPPGFPFYLMLAHLVSLVPVGNVATRVNFASALFAALASGILTLVVTELMIGVPSFPQEKKESHQAQVNGRLLLLAPALGAGLVFAFSRTLWSY